MDRAFFMSIIEIFANTYWKIGHVQPWFKQYGSICYVSIIKVISVRKCLIFEDNSYSVGTPFEQFFRRAKNKFSQQSFWWSHKYFTNISIIIKQTFFQNFGVYCAIVLVLFKILNCCNSIFMRKILFSHGYITTKYVRMNGIKKS
jgi:hypothetical protein